MRINKMNKRYTNKKPQGLENCQEKVGQGGKQMRQKVKRKGTKGLNRLRNTCMWQIRSHCIARVPSGFCFNENQGTSWKTAPLRLRVTSSSLVENQCQSFWSGMYKCTALGWIPM